MKKNFRINVIVRVIVMMFFMAAFFIFIKRENYIITPIFFGILVLVQTIELIKYVDRTNRVFVNFLDSIRFSDFTKSYNSQGLGSSFDELKQAFDRIIIDFQKIKSEKEEHTFILQKIIQHIDLNIIAFNKKGDIEIINDAAQRFFNIYKFKNISSLNLWSSELKQVLDNIKSGENKLVKIQKNENFMQLLVYASEFIVNNKEIKLVSIKNIHSELEEQELESWQKLIRVLTHEIMNSIAPIASLSSTVNQMLDSVTSEITPMLPKYYDFESINDIKTAIETIHKRSIGLEHFVETYRNLTRIPNPQVKQYSVKDQFKNILELMSAEITEKNIETEISVIPEKLKLHADEQLIEQVLINMIKNSIHAFDKSHKNPKIILRAYIDNSGRENIQVSDNGNGILPELFEKVFIPFFTTKQEGSGIGLSLSKQIMRLHGGTIKLKSEPYNETSFTLIF